MMINVEEYKMKVIKRDGSVVDYDSNKIYSAITRANRDVVEE